jgi:hypothetical protein
MLMQEFASDALQVAESVFPAPSLVEHVVVGSILTTWASSGWVE